MCNNDAHPAGQDYDNSKGQRCVILCDKLGEQRDQDCIQITLPYQGVSSSDLFTPGNVNSASGVRTVDNAKMSFPSDSSQAVKKLLFLLARDNLVPITFVPCLSPGKDYQPLAVDDEQDPRALASSYPQGKSCIGRKWVFKDENQAAKNHLPGWQWVYTCTCLQLGSRRMAASRDDHNAALR
jgi:hypothetical protein